MPSLQDREAAAVTGAWGSRSTVDSHDESMEVTKDLEKSRSGVIVTLNQTNADYTVMLTGGK